MIMINDQWEHVTTLDEIIKLIRDDYNKEVADKLESLVGELNQEIEYLNDYVDELNYKLK